jgi:K+-sensing histidine kinase KdpD
MQTSNLNEEQLELIQSIGDNSRHLSQLNRSLALLFKIDHHHYSSTGQFYPSTGIMRQLDNLNELIELKELKLTTHLPQDITIPMDPVLGDILVYNLVKNAIVHNQHQGMLDIHLQADILRLVNNGPALLYPADQYFSEFIKGPESKGLGLGLALVRKICEVSGLTVKYTYNQSFHQFEITWHEKTNKLA